MQVSKYILIAGISLAALGLAGCAGMSTDERNAAIGAAGGAVVADITDQNVAAGAALGAAGGALCNDVGICQ